MDFKIRFSCLLERSESLSSIWNQKLVSFQFFFIHYSHTHTINLNKKKMINVEVSQSTHQLRKFNLKESSLFFMPYRFKAEKIIFILVNSLELGRSISMLVSSEEKKIRLLLPPLSTGTFESSACEKKILFQSFKLFLAPVPESSNALSCRSIQRYLHRC